VRHILAIGGRELRSMFVTPDAYVTTGFYLLFAGFIFFASLGIFISQLQQIQALGMTQLLEQWNLQDVVVAQSFSTFALFFAFMVPMLSMRAFAAERANGTIELLLTSPASSGEIVLGKYLAIAVMLLLVNGLTAAFVGLLFLYGNPEVLQTLAGLQTLFLYSLALAAICCFISALTRSQIVAGFIGIAASLLLLIIPVAADSSQSESLREVLRWAGTSTHFEPGMRGEIRSEDLAYFAIVILVFLSLARAAVDSLRWR
jgi:ABC-2 type transport system permease protein